LLRLRARPIKTVDRQRIGLTIDRFDPRDGSINKLRRRDLATSQQADNLRRRLLIEFAQ